MRQHNKETNNLLARVVERFLFHTKLATEAANPVVEDGARKMCDIELWEMWTLTQD